MYGRLGKRVVFCTLVYAVACLLFNRAKLRSLHGYEFSAKNPLPEARWRKLSNQASYIPVQWGPSTYAPLKAGKEASLNPPAQDALHPSVSRGKQPLTIAIACGVHSGGFDPGRQKIGNILPLRVLLRSFLPSAQPFYAYRLYLAFDYNDPVYANQSLRSDIEEEFSNLVHAESELRLHNAKLAITLHWVQCNYSGKPSWAHNDAVMAAYNEGADYALRVNDDTQMPTRLDWLEAFVVDLHSRQPIPNLGVVGPTHEGGKLSILTHDFTHRMHAAIFGYHYPRSLPDWSSDDWITLVYGQYKHPPLMHKLSDVRVVHMLAKMRYLPTPDSERLKVLHAEVAKGKRIIDNFARTTIGVELS